MKSKGYLHMRKEIGDNGMLKILVSIAICISITAVLLYRRNKSRAEMLSLLMISLCILFVSAFFLSFRHADLSPLSVLFGITILVLLFGFGKTKPITTWKGIFREYREILYGDQYRVKDFASFIEANRKKYAYWKKNYSTFLISVGLTIVIMTIWVLIEKLVRD